MSASVRMNSTFVERADDPMSIVPKPLVIEPLFKALTVVKDDVTIADPNVVAFKTEALLIE